MKTKDEIMHLLENVTDPEIPVLNIIELGIIRDVIYENELLIVSITPTYSGCPAIEMIKQEIRSALIENGINKFEINVVYSPAWTTDWMAETAHEKLRNYGIAPPGRTIYALDFPINDKVNCPFCESEDTQLRSFFGSTACKSLYQCHSCNQPFEHFKKF